MMCNRTALPQTQKAQCKNTAPFDQFLLGLRTILHPHAVMNQ